VERLQPEEMQKRLAQVAAGSPLFAVTLNLMGGQKVIDVRPRQAEFHRIQNFLLAQPARAQHVSVVLYAQTSAELKQLKDGPLQRGVNYDLVVPVPVPTQEMAVDLVTNEFRSGSVTLFGIAVEDSIVPVDGPGQPPFPSWSDREAKLVVTGEIHVPAGQMSPAGYRNQPDVRRETGGPSLSAARVLAQISRPVIDPSHVMGLKVSHVARIGDDEAGTQLVESLSRQGVDVSGMRVVPGVPSATTLALVLPGGRSVYNHVRGASDHLTGNDLRPADYQAKVLGIHGAELGAEFMPGVLPVLRRAKAAKQIVTLDTVVDPLHQWAKFSDGDFREILSLVDVFIPSIGEARAIIQQREKLSDDAAAALTPEQIADYFMEGNGQRGTRAVFLKLGDKGSFIRTLKTSVFGRATALQLPVLQGLNIVDETGMGDAYAGAVIKGILMDWPVEKIALVATATGGLVGENFGGTLGNRSLVDVLLAAERLKSQADVQAALSAAGLEEQRQSVLKALEQLRADFPVAGTAPLIGLTWEALQEKEPAETNGLAPYLLRIGELKWNWQAYFASAHAVAHLTRPEMWSTAEKFPLHNRLGIPESRAREFESRVWDVFDELMAYNGNLTLKLFPNVDRRDHKKVMESKLIFLSVWMGTLGKVRVMFGAEVVRGLIKLKISFLDGSPQLSELQAERFLTKERSDWPIYVLEYDGEKNQLSFLLGKPIHRDPDYLFVPSAGLEEAKTDAHHRLKLAVDTDPSNVPKLEYLRRVETAVNAVKVTPYALSLVKDLEQVQSRLQDVPRWTILKKRIKNKRMPFPARIDVLRAYRQSRESLAALRSSVGNLWRMWQQVQIVSPLKTTAGAEEILPGKGVPATTDSGKMAWLTGFIADRLRSSGGSADPKVWAILNRFLQGQHSLNAAVDLIIERIKDAATRKAVEPYLVATWVIARHGISSDRGSLAIIGHALMPPNHAYAIKTLGREYPELDDQQIRGILDEVDRLLGRNPAAGAEEDIQWQEGVTEGRVVKELGSYPSEDFDRVAAQFGDQIQAVGHYPFLMGAVGLDSVRWAGLDQFGGDLNAAISQAAGMAKGLARLALRARKHPVRVESDLVEYQDPTDGKKKLMLVFMAADLSTGLEETGRQIGQEWVQRFLSGLEEAAPHKMRPIVVAQSLREMDSRFERLAGLEEQGVYLHRVGEEADLMIQIAEKADGFVLAGLEEEAMRMKPFAGPLKLRMELVAPGHRRFEEMVVGLLSRATGLEEAAIQARAGFSEFMAGLEEADSQA